MTFTFYLLLDLEPVPPVTEAPIVIQTNPVETGAPKESETTISPTKLNPPTTENVKSEATTLKPKVTEINAPASVPVQSQSQKPATSAAAAAPSSLPAKPAQSPKIVTQIPPASSSSSSSSTSLAKSSTTSSLLIDNVVHDPEYDLLSRQPPQYVEENYRVVSLRPNQKNSRPAVVVTPEKNTAPTSSVLATKASSSSHASSSSRSHKNKKHKVRPSSTLQVLKTAAPVQHPKISASSKAPSHRSSSSGSSTSRKSSKKGSRTTTTTTTTPQPQEEVVIVKSSSSSSTRNKPKR